MASQATFECDLCDKKTKTQGGPNKHRDSQSCKDRAIKLSRQQAAQHPAEVSQESQENKPLRCFQSSTTIRRIPKGARPAAAAAFLKLLRDCYQKNDEESWCKFLCFPSIALAQRDESLRGEQSLTSVVKANISRPQASEQFPVKKASRKKPPNSDTDLREKG
ncbi:hypothetical protein RvY_17033 [Ramazzottius varieornatus]|uniref:Uncharacterized protein n=1 Tax=Ramazzottius varieornatus TaxID=947166 RepID=A0A1D1W4S5_RAMVA|nr:hypothetical protein RvY_17033 [Ramazzottius varieornatus]